MTVKLPSSFSRPLPFPLLFILIVPQGFLFLGGRDLSVASFLYCESIFLSFSFSLVTPIFLFSSLFSIYFLWRLMLLFSILFSSLTNLYLFNSWCHYFISIRLLSYFSSNSFPQILLFFFILSHFTFFYFTSSFLLVLYALPTPTFCQGHD